MLADKRKPDRPWRGAGLIVTWITVLAGIVYAVYQYRRLGLIEDRLFIGILMANTYAIYRFTMYLKWRMRRAAPVYVPLLGKAYPGFDEQRLIDEIFPVGRCLTGGFIFAMTFFAGAWFIAPWGHDDPLTFALAAFLFCVNFITGMAVYSLFAYFREAMRIGREIDVDLWDRSHPALSTLLENNRFVVLATAAVASAGMISVLFSKFKPDMSIIVFSVFSVSLILLAWLIPMIPVTRKIWNRKKRCLEQMGQCLQAEFSVLMENAKQAGYAIDTARFDAMLRLRKAVGSTRTFPPVGEYSIVTTLYVTMLTMLPSVIEFVYDQLRGS